GLGLSSVVGERKGVWGSVLGVEAVGQPAAVDVEGFEDLADGRHRDAPVQRPLDDVEVFLAGLEAVEDAVEQEGVVVEAAEEETEVAAVEFDPEAGSLEVFQPAGPQVAPPVVLHPTADGRLTQVATGLLTLDPFVTLGFLHAVEINAA